VKASIQGEEESRVVLTLKREYRDEEVVYRWYCGEGDTEVSGRGIQNALTAAEIAWGQWGFKVTEEDACSMAIARISDTPELQPYREFILDDWADPDHYYWVASAPLQEVLSWAEEGDDVIMLSGTRAQVTERAWQLIIGNAMVGEFFISWNVQEQSDIPGAVDDYVENQRAVTGEKPLRFWWAEMGREYSSKEMLTKYLEDHWEE
jgi:hypothetical protein